MATDQSVRGDTLRRCARQLGLCRTRRAEEEKIFTRHERQKQRAHCSALAQNRLAKGRLERDELASREPLGIPGRVSRISRR